MRRMNYFFGAILSLFLQAQPSLFAVEGFPEALENLHPEFGKVNCLNCHAIRHGEKPSYQNVSEKGRAFYQELMEHEARRNKERQTFADALPQVDFAVYGDTRSQDAIHRSIVEQICADNPQFALHTGDMVADGSKSEQWQTALGIEACLLKDKKIVHACGNHEGRFCTRNAIRDALGVYDAYYTVVRGAFTFIILNANDISSEQISWLKALPVGPNYIPVYHQAPYPTMAGHGSEKSIVQNFVPEFKRLGVKLAFNGHNHGYDRALVDGVQYVTVGGGGAPLYPCGKNREYTQLCLSDYSYARCAMRDSRIECNVKTREGAIVDQFAVSY